VSNIKIIYEKVKYYLLVLVILIVLFLILFFFNLNSLDVSHKGYKFIFFEATLSAYWWEMLIGAFILTIVIHWIVQYFVWKGIQNFKDRQNKIREKSEIHSMKYGVRRN